MKQRLVALRQTTLLPRLLWASWRRLGVWIECTTPGVVEDGTFPALFGDRDDGAGVGQIHV